MPGYIRSASYILHMVGPSGKIFNFSDSFNFSGLNPAIFWFAKKTEDAGLLFTEKRYISADNADLKIDRMLPAAIIWGAGLKLETLYEPKSNFWVGQGISPVCLMRTSWNKKSAIYLGLKSGTPSASHGHMDVGSFVMDANGVQWVSDLGAQAYYSLESKGIKLWDGSQYSQRWKIFRYNNLAHSTLTFNDSLQRVTGVCKIEAWSDNKNKMFASTNLTPVYKEQVKNVVRTASIIDKAFVSIKDEIETLSTTTKVRWTIPTQATAVLNPTDNSIELTKEGQKLKIKVNAPLQVTLKTWSTRSPNSYDAPNNGYTLVGFEAQLPPNSKTVLNVSLIPVEK